MSIAPVTASSSFSQSNRLSWQPSQDANFHTASFGLFFRCTAILLNFPFAQKMFYLTMADNWSIFADKFRPKLAVTAQPNPTFHISFQRNIDVVTADPALFQFHRCEAHHHFRAAYHCYRIAWIKRRSYNQLCDQPNAAAPIARRPIYR